MSAAWPHKPLSDVCDVVNGGTPKTGVPEYWDGVHAWITPAEMGRRAHPYVGSTARTLTELGLRDSSARLLPPNSVILSSRAPIGHLVINEVPMATNQGCKGLVPRTRLEAKFLYYYLSSIVEELNELGTGTTFKELSAGKLKEVVLPLPPASEQQRIVTILDEAFEGIAAAKANAEANLRSARALFEGHIHFIIRQIAGKWETQSIKDFVDAGVVQLTRGKVISKNDIAAHPGEFPVYSSARENDGQLGKYGFHMFDEELITWSIDGGGRLFHRRKHKFSVTNVGGILRIRRPEIVSYDYLFRVLSYLHSQVRFDWVRKAHPSVILKLYDNIPTPPLDNQRQIAKSIDLIEGEIEHLVSIYQTKLEALDELKQSLLHHAFTGQLTERTLAAHGA